MNLSALSYDEVEDILAEGAVALWPIGSTEAHGPHLPLDTDVIIARTTAERAVPVIEAQTKLRALVLPALPYTVTDFVGPFRGTLSLPRETALALVRDTARAAADQGFLAVCLVNAHLEPAHRFMLRDAVKAANLEARCPIGIADPADARFAQSLTPEFASGSCHAGQYETSLVMAADRTRVRGDAQRALPRVDIDLVREIKAGKKTLDEAGGRAAYCGAPAAASAAEGEASYARLVEIVTTVVGELLSQRGAKGETR
ncbi:MAG: creatininase family protein [Myxococcota bacterium]